MSGEVVCQRRSVTVLSCSSSGVEDRTTLRLTQEAEVSQQEEAQQQQQQQEEVQQQPEEVEEERRSTQGRTASSVLSRDLMVAVTEKETRCAPPPPPPPPLPAPPPQLLPRLLLSPSELSFPPSPLHNNNNNNNNSSQRRGARTKIIGRKSTRRTAAGKNSQSRKVTDFYPIRRSSRKSQTEQNSEQKRLLDRLITDGIEDGMEVQHIEGKGRAVFATRSFQKGEYVVEYHGDLLHINDARQREDEYAQNPATGCYMYYFQYLCKTYCVDATRESGRLGRLINHSKNGNCQTKLHDIDGVPHLILVASREVERGEELLYDYGDRSKASIDAHPWLKY